MEEKNGFFAFYSALLVRSSTGVGGESPHSMEEWNSPDLWRQAFARSAEGLLFFAEDLFGVQFALAHGGAEVWTFDPETGGRAVFASDVDAWCSRVLSDADVVTGYRLAKDWQELHGALPASERLVPKIPFVLGGDYGVANLWACESVIAMRSRAAIAVQIADLPDGARVRLRITE